MLHERSKTRILVLVTVLGVITTISGEVIPTSTWFTHFGKLPGEIISQSNPLAEGFILSITGKNKVPSFNTTTTTLQVILTTTCRVVTTITVLQTPLSNHRSVHESALMLSQPTTDEEDETRSFLYVDDELMNSRMLIDGSGETTSDTTEPPTSIPSSPTTSSTTSTVSTTTQTRAPILTDLVGPTLVRMTGNCSTLNSTLEKISSMSQPLFNVTYNLNVPCNDSGPVEIDLLVNGDSSLGALTNFLTALATFGKDAGVDFEIVDRCDDGQSAPMTNLNPCFLIDLCDLCGSNPIRGVCEAQKNVSRCTCIADTNDPLVEYLGDLCRPTTISLSPAPRWTPIVVGILSALAALLCLSTCCLLGLAWWGHRPPMKDELLIRRIWHLPRALVPITVSAENAERFTNDSNSTSASDPTRSETANDSFFDDLDQRLNAGLPEDPITQGDNDDPIHELDAIINREDVSTPFHDALDQNPSEFINPNLKLTNPRS